LNFVSVERWPIVCSHGSPVCNRAYPRGLQAVDIVGSRLRKLASWNGEQRFDGRAQ